MLLHTAPGRQAWDEWLSPDLAWPERRRALVETPLPDRADWHSRLLLASHHRRVPQIPSHRAGRACARTRISNDWLRRKGSG